MRLGAVVMLWVAMLALPAAAQTARQPQAVQVAIVMDGPSEQAASLRALFLAEMRAERLLDASPREYGRQRPPTATAALLLLESAGLMTAMAHSAVIQFASASGNWSPAASIRGHARKPPFVAWAFT